MFSRNNKRKDKAAGAVAEGSGKAAAEQTTEPVTPKGGADDAVGVSADMSREELLQQSEEARKIMEDIRSLRASVEALKTDDIPPLTDGDSGAGAGAADGQTQGAATAAGTVIEDTEAVLAAKQAIIEQAKKDEEERRLREAEERLREQERQQARQEILEAERRAALREAEAERRRLEAEEAARKARAISRQQALEAMEAETRAKNEELTEEVEKTRENRDDMATPEEMRAFFGEDSAAAKAATTADVSADRDRGEAEPAMGVDEARQELLRAQRQQDQVIGTISKAAEVRTEKLAERQQETLDKIRSEELAAAERRKAEKLERARRKKEEKIHRAEEKERLKREKREKREAAERERIERERLRQKSIADAELGGGVVNVKGVKINTKIKHTLSVSLKDLLGIADREERRETSEEKAQQMKEEREKRREEAREAVELTVKQRLNEYENSPFGRKMRKFKNFCERYKVALLSSFSVFILLLVGVAGVYNYYTAYAYSYNGQTLGLVKEKDEVLRITDLVSDALTEDRNIDVVVDDIEFERVSATGDVKIDTSEDVLRRLSYMRNINVKAYGIYIDGRKVGAVESKEAVENVMEDIREIYTSDLEDAEIKSVKFLNEVDVKKGNNDLEDVLSEEEMLERLITSGEKTVEHRVAGGETLADLAKQYRVTEEDIIEDNPDVDRKKLEVGSVLTIHQTAPVLSVEVVAQVTDEEKVSHKTEKRKDPDMYEGYSETSQKGKDGLNEVTARVTLVNGEQVEEKNKVTTVKKEPVTEIIMVGSKERPPSVGSGEYIWPVSGGYTLTSEFGGRWGRMHEGIDLGLPVGTDILAADGGIVTFAGYSGGYGYVVKVDHQNGMSTTYAHNSSLLVSTGDEVFKGMHIAESGNSGRSTGPHLHFEIRVDGVAQNPLNYLP